MKNSKAPEGNSAKTPLGQILLRRGHLKEMSLKFILDLQKQYRVCDRHQLLGELLLSHRVISALELTEALAVQEEMPDESVTAIVERFEKTMSALRRSFAVEITKA